MNSLFASFSPVSIFGLSMNWLSSLFCLVLIPLNFWLMSNQYKEFFVLIVSLVYEEMKAIYSKFSAPGTAFLTVAMFVFLILNNFLGLLPYVFTSSSHLTFTLSFSLPLWVGHMIYGFTKISESMMAHFIPMSTPAGLIPLMALIEFTSGIIRPLTLAVRLAANMIAGHLLLCLLSKDMPGMGVLTLLICMFMLVLLMVLELAVSVIQSYVFSLLMTLYVNEVSMKNTNLV